MSKEHFWPEWSAPMLPRTKNPSYHEGKITITRKSTIVDRKLQKRQGSVATKKIRVVCEDCNNGWMNNVETNARPILELLIAGNPTTLNQDQQRVLTERIIMKVMVAEHNIPEDAVIPRVDKETFRTDKIIPPCISVWIGKHNVSGWHTGFYKHAATLSLKPSPPLSAAGGRKNVETLAFGFGALFGFVMVSDPGWVDLKDFIRVVNLPRLWPPVGGDLNWGALTLSGNAPGDIATPLSVLPLTRRFFGFRFLKVCDFGSGAPARAGSSMAYFRAAKPQHIALVVQKT